MKYAEFKVDGNKIEFYNSIFGKENVHLNGNSVSNKFSFFGTNHTFQMNNSKMELKSSCQAFTSLGVDLELKKEGELVEKIKVKPNKQTIIWAIIGMLIGIAIVRINF